MTFFNLVSWSWLWSHLSSFCVTAARIRLAAANVRNHAFDFWQAVTLARINRNVNDAWTASCNALFSAGKLTLCATALICNTLKLQTANFLLNLNHNDLLASFRARIFLSATTAILSGSHHWETHSHTHDGRKSKLKHSNLICFERCDNTSHLCVLVSRICLSNLTRR